MYDYHLYACESENNANKKYVSLEHEYNRQKEVIFYLVEIIETYYFPTLKKCPSCGRNAEEMIFNVELCNWNCDFRQVMRGARREKGE